MHDTGPECRTLDRTSRQVARGARFRQRLRVKPATHCLGQPWLPQTGNAVANTTSTTEPQETAAPIRLSASSVPCRPMRGSFTAILLKVGPFRSP